MANVGAGSPLDGFTHPVRLNDAVNPFAPARTGVVVIWTPSWSFLHVEVVDNAYSFLWSLVEEDDRLALVGRVAAGLEVLHGGQVPDGGVEAFLRECWVSWRICDDCDPLAERIARERPELSGAGMVGLLRRGRRPPRWVRKVRAERFTWDVRENDDPDWPEPPPSGGVREPRRPRPGTGGPGFALPVPTRVGETDFPDGPGVYVVYRNPDDATPLYIGSAAEKGIRARWLSDHLSDRSGSSALRRSLGPYLGLVAEKLKRPNRYYPPDVEEAITEFLHTCWVSIIPITGDQSEDEARTDPRTLETTLITRLRPLLNLAHNVHPEQ